MAVLGVFCEDIDFPNGVVPTVTTNGSYFRGGFARCAFAGSPNIETSLCKSTTFPSITTCWVLFHASIPFAGSGVYSRLLCGLGKSGTSSGIFFGVSNAANAGVGIYTFNGSSIGTCTSALTLVSGSLHRFDVQVINFGTNGTVNVYVDGSLACTYTGNLDVSGIGSLDSIFVGGCNQGWPGYVSEIIVADEPTLGWQGVDMREITANGTTQQWSNPDISNFDPITINDANSTYSNTAGQDEQAALANSVAGNFAIKAVKIVARANAPAGSAVTNLKLGLRNGSGTVGVGAAHPLTSAFAPVSDLLTVDPTTGQPFTSIDGYQLDLRSA